MALAEEYGVIIVRSTINQTASNAITPPVSGYYVRVQEISIPYTVQAADGSGSATAAIVLRLVSMGTGWED